MKSLHRDISEQTLVMNLQSQDYNVFIVELNVLHWLMKSLHRDISEQALVTNLQSPHYNVFIRELNAMGRSINAVALFYRTLFVDEPDNIYIRTVFHL